MYLKNSLEASKDLVILLIDDNQEVVESMKIFLELEGCFVRTARNGKEGLDEVKHCKPNIIILDIGLPDLDGFEIAKQIRKYSGKPLKQLIIAMSGYPPPKNSEATSVFDYYLIKPLDIDQLKQIILNY